MGAFFITNQLPGRTLITETEEYLYFSGTSYLGMGHNKSFRAYLTRNLAIYGANYSSSRLSNVQLSIFAETEAYLAAWTGAEAALVVSSGLLAGQLVIRMLTDKGTFFYGPRTHPALWRHPLDLSTETYTGWSQTLPNRVQQATEQEIIIVSNSIDVLWAQNYDLSWLYSLPAGKNITIVIDDSHGLGITGANGAGVYSEITGLPSHVQVIVISSLGKALGIPGGVVLSNRTVIAQLRNQAFFGGGSPPVPAYLAAFIKSAPLYEQARETLLQNIRYFTAHLRQSELFQFFPNYPVFYTPEPKLYEWLLRRKILVSHFAYPSPTDLPITRIVLNALHTKADINILLKQIHAFLSINS